MGQQLHFALLTPFLHLGLFVAPAQAQPLDVIQFTSGYYAIVENARTVAVEVQRTGRMTDYATVTLRTERGTADEWDFVPFEQTVEFVPGQSNLVVNLEIVNDSLMEGSEFFDVILSEPDPFCCELGLIARARVEILDNDLGVQFASDYYSVIENAGELQIEITRLGDMRNEAGNIGLEIAELTATNNVDFIITTNRVWFLPGQTNATISISIINDAVPGGFKQFILRFESNPDPVCCSLGNPRAAVINILDNDRGIEFSNWSFYVAEENPEPVIQLHRLGDLVAQECFFTIRFSNGTATNDLDYSLGQTIFVFAAGQSNLNLPVFIHNDALREGTESFSLYLDEFFDCPYGYQTASTIYIQDNDPGVFFSPSAYTATENEQQAAIHLSRLGDATNAFTVDLVLGGSAIHGTDFILPTNRLHFAAGQTNLSLVLPLLDDPLVEGEEYIYLYLTNASDNVPLGLVSTCTVTLQDNEYPSVMPGFWFSSNQLFAAENQTNAFVTVIRGGNSSSTLSVDFVTAGSATVGVDFSPASGTLVFQPLETVKQITLRVVDDCGVETNETADIALTNPSPAAVIFDPGRATTLWIVDDDAPGSLERLNAAFDETPLSGDSAAMALQPDGKIVVAHNGVISRLNSDGSLDASFQQGASICDLCYVHCLVIQPNGEILAGGDGGAIRLDPRGAPDADFDFRPTRFLCWVHGACFTVRGAIAALLWLPVGKIFAVGWFDIGNGMVRLNSDSTPDTNFMVDSAVGGAFARAALQPDGKLLVATSGGFLHRLNEDGSRDTSFLSGADSSIGALAVLPDQKILIGGSFSVVNNSGSRQGLARLEGNGSLDENFNPAIAVESYPMISASALALAKDGSFVVAGQFSDGSTRVVKLDPNGSLIPAFNSGLRFSGWINSIIEEPNGELLMAGNFSSVNGIPRPGIARLKSARSHIQLSPPQLRPDGSLRIVTGSHVGSSYILQRSSDLTAWTDISTNVATDCTLELQDPNPASTRFYRVVKLNR